jgi:hypothetical protein
MLFAGETLGTKAVRKNPHEMRINLNPNMKKPASGSRE